MHIQTRENKSYYVVYTCGIKTLNDYMCNMCRNIYYQCYAYKLDTLIHTCSLSFRTGSAPPPPPWPSVNWRLAIKTKFLPCVSIFVAVEVANTSHNHFHNFAV